MSLASYVDMMNSFRSGKSHAAVLETPRGRNPLSVDRSYSRWQDLEADLTRYYEECIVSSSAKRLQGARRKSYCAGVAWKRVKSTGHYSDYPGFSSRERETKRNPMAGKSRKKSLAAKRRKRDRFGRFSEPAAKKRTKAKASEAPSRRSRKKKSAGRNPAKRKTTTRKASTPRRRRRITRAREATMAMASEAPRRRRRKRRATVRENPVDRKSALKGARTKARKKAARRRAAKKAAATRKRHLRMATARPARRRRRRTASKAAPRRRRGSRRRGMSQREMLALLLAKQGRRRSTRKSSRRRRKPVRRKPRARRLRGELHPSQMAWENPLFGGGALENPLSGGELALAFVTGGIGYALTDVLDRFMATKKDDPNNAITIQAAPSITRMAAQAGLTAAPFALAYFVRQPMGRAALQGFGLGAGFHLLGQVVRTYVMGKMLKENDYGKQLYPDVIAAEDAADRLAPAKETGKTAGVSGLPRGLGSYYREVGPYAGTGVGMVLPGYSPVMIDPRLVAKLPQTGGNGNGSGAPVAVSYPPGSGAPVAVSYPPGGGAPVAIAPGEPYPSAPVYGTMPIPVYGPTNGGYPQGPQVGGRGCMPCSAETSHAALVSAYNAAREEVGCNGCGGGCGGYGVGAPPSFKTKVGSAFPD